MTLRDAAACVGIFAAAATPGCRSPQPVPAPPPGARHLATLEEDARQGRTTTAETLLLAKAWIAGGDHQKALALLDRLTVTDATLENRRQILRGLSLEGLMWNADAWTAYEAALAAVPEDPAALLREAAYSFRSGELVRALNYARQSLARQPGNPEGYFLLYALESDAQARDRALLNLIGADGPDGPWATRALSYRGR